MSSPTDDGKPEDGLDGALDQELDQELDEQLVIEVNEELEVARCSFCGRSAFEVDRLVAQGGARICNFCIKEFHGRMNPNPGAGPGPKGSSG